jgi:hypothetical protein
MRQLHLLIAELTSRLAAISIWSSRHLVIWSSLIHLISRSLNKP